MIVHFEDTDYQFDFEALDLAQARAIKRQTGLTIQGLIAGLESLDPEALVALYWLMRVQNGATVDINKVNFKVLKFGEALAAASAAEKEADPTPAAPSDAPTT